MPSTATSLAADTIATLVHRHQDGLRSYLRWLRAPADSIDDLVQDAFVAMLAHPFEHRDEARTGAWLRTVARHLLQRRLREGAKGRRTVELDEAAAAWEHWLGGDDGAVMRDALRACLRSLNARQGEAVRLRYGEGLELAAVGQRLGIGTAGAETLLRRLRAVLRTCIRRRLA